MRLVKLFRPTLLWFALAGLGLAAGCSSNTTKQIKAFADKICACQDAACASSVQTEYLAWWKENQRARGGEGDRKDIEKAMQRYAECHLALVGPEESAPAVNVPTVDLTRPEAPPSAAPQESEAHGAAGDAPVAVPAPSVPENEAASESSPTTPANP
jgi:hypothetical protein